MGLRVWVVKRSTARALNLVVSTQQEGQTRLQGLRRKSIGATSQAFHEPMSTGAFLDLQASDLLARSPRLGAAHKNSPGACGPGLQGAWGPGPQGLGPGPPGAWGLFPTKPPKPLKLRFFANLLVGAWRRRGCRLKRLLRRWGPGGKRSRDTPPTPPPPTPPPRFLAVREKGRGFSPSPPSATIQHAPQGRRIYVQGLRDSCRDN